MVVEAGSVSDVDEEVPGGVQEARNANRALQLASLAASRRATRCDRTIKGGGYTVI